MINAKTENATALLLWIHLSIPHSLPLPLTDRVLRRHHVNKLSLLGCTHNQAFSFFTVQGKYTPHAPQSGRRERYQRVSHSLPANCKNKPFALGLCRPADIYNGANLGIASTLYLEISQLCRLLHLE
jgi:hypothetical protein